MGIHQSYSHNILQPQGRQLEAPVGHVQAIRALLENAVTRMTVALLMSCIRIGVTLWALFLFAQTPLHMASSEMQQPVAVNVQQLVA